MDAAQHELVHEHHYFGKTAGFAPFGCKRVQFQIVVFRDIDLSLLLHHLQRKYIENELVDHYANTEDICFFAVLFVSDLLRRGVGQGETSAISIVLQQLALVLAVALP